VLQGAKQCSQGQNNCSWEHLSGALLWSISFLHNVSRYHGSSLPCQSLPSKTTANTAAAASLSPTPPPSLPTAAGQRRAPRCHHLADYRLYRQCRTNVSASLTTPSPRAQRGAHWEGAKFDVVVTTRTRAVAVAAAAAMRWGGRTSRQG